MGDYWIRYCARIVHPSPWWCISWTGETVENFMPPLWVPETQVNKQLLLVTTNSQARNPQTIPNISNMMALTHIATEKYWESTLVISVSDTERGGIEFSTVSPAQEIMMSYPISWAGETLEISCHPCQTLSPRWLSGGSDPSLSIPEWYQRKCGHAVNISCVLKSTGLQNLSH